LKRTYTRQWETGYHKEFTDSEEISKWKCVTDQIFGDDSNKSKFDSGEKVRGD
jgi:hypothetical protein